MVLRFVMLLLTVLVLPAPALAQPTTPPKTTVRLFIDLECPFSRQAWPVYRKALAGSPDAAFVVQQLPLSRHRLAMAAAIAAVAARAQDREIAFIDALFHEATPDDPAILRAAQSAGLDLQAFERTRHDPNVSAQVTREQQAGLAMGIRSTPSALVDGRGIAGVPQADVLTRALASARQQAEHDVADVGANADVERLGTLRLAPEFLPALDALRQSRALEAPSTAAAKGCLGPRWRVQLAENDVAFGPEAAVTAVLFLDPASPWQLHELATLLRLQLQEAQAGRSDIRVVVKLLLGEARQGWKSPPLALWLGATVLTAPTKGATFLRQLIDNAMQSAQGDKVVAAIGLDAATLRKAADAPTTTAWLQVSAELARRVNATPGAIYLNGRRWLGHAGDDGLPAALAALRTECAGVQGKPSQVYSKLVATGRLLQDAELELAGPSTIGSLAALPTLGDHGQPVFLFVNFRSPHSRAAFYMLRRLVRSADLPIRLVIAAIPRGPSPGQSPSGSAILAATRLGKGMEMAEALFNADKPDDAATLSAALKKCKLDVTTFQKALAAPQTTDALQAVWHARERLDMQDEPAIYIGGRQYRGPLDESRLERAVRFVEAAPSPPATPAAGQP